MRRTIVLWAIVTVNRQTRQIGRRQVWADSADIPPEQFLELLALLQQPEKAAAYRSLFKPERPAGEDIEVRTCVSAFPSRYEDEAENELTQVEFHEALVGQPILLQGDPASVIRFGAFDMRGRKKWSVQKANKIAHFLDVSFYLRNSPWLQTKPNAKYRLGAEATADDVDGTKLISYTGPDIYTLNSVLAFARQLHLEKDELFEKACNIYLEHCSDGSRAQWVQSEMVRFKQILNETSYHYMPYTGGQIIDMFLYGFGLMHVPKTQENQPAGQTSRYVMLEDFRVFVEKRGPKTALIALHFTLLDLLFHVATIATVITQDFRQWMENPRHKKPTRVSLFELLGGGPSVTGWSTTINPPPPSQIPGGTIGRRIIFWPVNGYNRTTGQPFKKELIADSAEQTDAGRSQLMTVMGYEDAVRLRPLFRERKPTDDLTAPDFQFITMQPEYAEDENGKRIPFPEFAELALRPMNAENNPN